MNKCRLCNNPVAGRGFCKSHYYKMKRTGMIDDFDKKERPIEERLKEKFIISDSGCWEWTGHKNHSGYPLIWKNGKAIKAHRESYRIFIGEFNKSFVICHKCDNPGCINPEHLFIGTRLTNNQDAMKKGRNAFGEKNGHAFLTKDQINEIKNDLRPQAKIAKDFGISQSHVSRIKAGKCRNKG